MIAFPLAVKFEEPVTFAPADWLIAPLALTVRLVAEIALRSIAFASVNVTVVPFAITVPKLLVDCVNEIANPLALKFDVPETFAAADCVIAPPVDRFRFVAEIVPSTIALLSVIETVVPFARIVAKLLGCVSVITSVDVKFAVPPETFADPVWVIPPPEPTVRFPAVIVPNTTEFVSVMEMVVPFASTVPKSLLDCVRAIAKPLALRFAVPETFAAAD